MSSDSVPRTYHIGDRVREWQTNEERYVIDKDGDALIVLADESKGRHSNRRRWLAANCTLVTACPYRLHEMVTLGNKNGTPGEIVEIKPHYSGKWLMYCVQRPQPSGGGSMTHWANEGALHPVALDAATSSVAAQVEEPVGDNLKATESPAEPLNLDDLPKPANQFDLVDHLQTQLVSARSERDDFEKRAADAQQFQRDAEARAEVAEKNNKKLAEQVKMLESVVTKPASVPQPCYEVKIERFRQDLPEDARRWSQLLYEGWKENSVNAVIDSGDRIYSVVVFKKLAESTPQPDRGTSGAHASLTASYVSQEMGRVTPSLTPDEIILEPVGQRTVGPIESSIRANGVEGTIQAMNGVAIDQAFLRARQRIEATPAFNRPLHSLKASN